jgi:tetratricopeptide (TPR) repeat protein
MSSRIIFAVAIAALGFGGVLLDAVPARADDVKGVATPAVDPQQWQKDQALEKASWADLHSGGLLAIAPHVPDLERALANAEQTMASAKSPDGAHVVFTDGDAETFIALAAVATDKSASSVKTEAQDNPYLGIGLCLGSYYNEIDKSEDALRVLSLALTLDAVQTGGLGLGDRTPYLVSEKGAALNALKRWPEAIVTFDAGLAIKDMEPAKRALLYRGRGFALTESGRLDDAEASYWESLKLEPGNTHAINELQYIGRLRAGKPPTQGGLFLAHPPASTTPPAAPATTTAPATPPPPAPVQN